MIKHAYISKSLEGLDFRKVYGLKKYDWFKHMQDHVVFFGMYRQEDIDLFEAHEGKVTLIWQGMDARTLNPEWRDVLMREGTRHIAISHWISKSLKKLDIPHALIPVSATIPKLNIVPRGDSIYTYSSDVDEENGRYYGDHYIDEIKERTGLNVIRATLQTYNKKDLKEIYSQCFINLRLTKYDGCPNTNLEMGLMGRRSIFNGKIPHSIKWKGIDDICASIMSEYERRHEDNTQIAKDVYDYINIGKSFLEI